MSLIAYLLMAVPVLGIVGLFFLVLRSRRKSGKRVDCVMRDGQYLAVMRPADPERALRVARGKVRAVRNKSELSKLLSDPKNTYTFVGLLTSSKRISDPQTGEDLGRVHAGDSYVGYDIILDAIETAQERT